MLSAPVVDVARFSGVESLFLGRARLALHAIEAQGEFMTEEGLHGS